MHNVIELFVKQAFFQKNYVAISYVSLALNFCCDLKFLKIC